MEHQTLSHQPLQIKHNGWPKAACSGNLPCRCHRPRCKHVVLLDVQSEEGRSRVVGLEAPLGPLREQSWRECVYNIGGKFIDVAKTWGQEDTELRERDDCEFDTI
ncbi:hypothetical protein DL546_004459 [Coniochaeta pulveracea]|uniref:Uncharacterized protein n=1 Tax=Coniochaeta pulveracea TaxID=177199 RepID=A0A420YDT7_9PEZI|nr:hypothetical protein DL546_004459 [Coniochaeta pulveracea]